MTPFLSASFFLLLFLAVPPAAVTAFQAPPTPPPPSFIDTSDPIRAVVIADSVYVGHRLTTLEVTLPRFLLPEWNTHRVFSRNSASSRAIPIRKRIRDTRRKPYVPRSFGRNKAGMQAGEGVSPFRAKLATLVWYAALYAALGAAAALSGLGVHKQWANRLIEPFSYTTVIVSATEWENFLAQRLHKDAQPEMQQVARAIRDALATSIPRTFRFGEYHLPYLQPGEEALPLEQKIRICVARCARVSYLTHDGRRDVDADLNLYDRLLTSGHMSPFEHVASAGVAPESNPSNFRGWTQARKRIAGEENLLGMLAAAKRLGV